MAIEHWRFLFVLYRLWHGTSVYNGHLQGPVTLTPIAERLAVEVSLPYYEWVCRGWDSNTQPSACGTHALTHCATTTAHLSVTPLQNSCAYEEVIHFSCSYRYNLIGSTLKTCSDSEHFRDGLPHCPGKFDYYLVYCCLLSLSRIFCSYGEVNLPVRGIFLVFTAIE